MSFLSAKPIRPRTVRSAPVVLRPRVGADVASSGSKSTFAILLGAGLGGIAGFKLDGIVGAVLGIPVGGVIGGLVT